MHSTGRYVLALVLGLAGLLAATLTAAWSAHHSSTLLIQLVLGTAAYLAVTGIAGRLTGIGAADAIEDSITALAAAAARIADGLGTLLIGAAAAITANDGTDTAIEAAEPTHTTAADPGRYAKTA
jgi:hypothetical protein